MSCETNVVVSENTKSLVDVIIKKNNLDPSSKVTYSAGANIGDGYMSNTLRVDIESATKSLKLFLKCALNVKSNEISMDRLFANEVYFYDYIYPTYLNFLNEHSLENYLQCIPKCYGVTEDVIALENLKEKGFELHTKGKLMNDSHTDSLFKSFARFHAVSFAFKDQKKHEYGEISSKLYSFEEGMQESSFENTVKGLIKIYMEKLDSVRDKEVLDKLQALCDNLYNTILMPAASNKTAILTKGDTWTNNTMFLYEGQNKDVPVDIMQVDWQMVRPSSPIFDICFFFYPSASEEGLNNLEHYLKIYHDELAKGIRQLGSDPDVLYSYDTLLKEWKQYSIYGYALSFLFCKMNLTANDEVTTFEDVGEVNLQKMNYANQDIRNEEIYTNRLRILTKHMLDNGFL